MVALLLAVVCYAAVALFVAGFAWRIWQWAATPIPFRIPTTTGQQASLRFLPWARLESPSTTLGVIGRVALEVLLFRSLFRNTGHVRHEGGRLTFPERKALWAAALAFHWALLIVVLRHLRLLLEPVPAAVSWLGALDEFFRAGTPTWYATDVVLMAALLWLLVRRLRDPLLRYLTLPADYLSLGLLLAIAGTGIAMRYWVRPDIVAIKQIALGLVSFHPRLSGSAGVSPLLAAHLLLVSGLLALFPFSKLMHAPAALLSPTRVLKNDSRRRRHVNPWNAPVAVHTYAEWESEFHDKIRAAGLPLDKQG
jgi:nitrate reductase gamma subunit